MFWLKFFLVLVGVVAYACELRTTYVKDCVVTGQFEGGTQFSCDKGLAYCCDTFKVTASEAATWSGCTGGVATSVKNLGIRAAFITKFVSTKTLLGCPYTNDFYGQFFTNGTAHSATLVGTGYGDFNVYVDDATVQAYALMTSQYCDYEVSGFESYST